MTLLLLTGCGGEAEEETPTDDEATTVNVQNQTLLDRGDGQFGISYASDERLNPYTTGSSGNREAGSLIYERLFTLDASFDAQYALCTDCTADETFTEYTLAIDTTAVFSDGVALTAADVVYSLKWARESDYYGDRLSLISGVEAAEGTDGDADAAAVTITLKSAHANLQVLLDIPIIPSGSIDERIPLGTGPYMYDTASETPRLIQNPQYSGDCPVDAVYLVESSDLGADFDSGAVDVMSLDLTNSSITYSTPRDARGYDTTILEYVGMNFSTISDMNFRGAIALAIDRSALVESCLGRNATVSVLPVSPASRLYPTSLAEAYTYNPDAAAKLLDQVAGSGFDLKKYENGEEQEAWLTLKLLVNADNAARYEMCLGIADDLEKFGIQVSVIGKSFDAYMEALEKREFDLFYGQVRLQTDFDISALVTGSGSLNYGKVSGDYGTYISKMLAAGSDEQADAAQELYTYITKQTPFVTIGFKQLSVVSARGSIMGMTLIQDNIYGNVYQWELGLY